MEDKAMTDQEKKENGKLAHAISMAINDGCLSREESDRIKRIIYVDHQASAEDLKLFRELQQKVWRGEVMLRDDCLGHCGAFQ
jgi:hypothetical protein